MQTSALRAGSLGCIREGTWLLSPAPPGSCPVGGGTLQGRPPLGPHESTASHAVKSWVGFGRWKGESLKTLSWLFFCQLGHQSACQVSQHRAWADNLGKPGLSTWPTVFSLVFGTPWPPERMRRGPSVVAEPGSRTGREKPEGSSPIVLPGP